MNRVVKIALFVVAAGLLFVASPVIYYTGLGLVSGHDVANGLANYFSPPAPGQTIEEQAVGYRDVRVTWRGEIGSERVAEASGLAHSGRADDTWFVINDSGGTAAIHAMDAAGKALGEWPVQGETLDDWEDLASFDYEGEPFLLIADTGDNFYWRQHVRLIAIPEPRLDRPGEAVIPAWAFDVTYPDDQRDSEAVAVAGDTVYLVSKRRVPAELYAVPLRPAEGQVVAERVSLLKGVPQPNATDLRQDPVWGATRSQPTALDIRGDTAVLLTYRDAYLYRFRDSWPSTFAGLPERIVLPKTQQQEALGINRAGTAFLVTTERFEGRERANIFEVAL